MIINSKLRGISSTTVIVEIQVTFKRIPETIKIVGYKYGEPLSSDPVGTVTVYFVLFFSV